MALAATPISTTTMAVSMLCTGHENKIIPATFFLESIARQTLPKNSPLQPKQPNLSATKSMEVDVTLIVTQAMVASQIRRGMWPLIHALHSSKVSEAMPKIANI